MYTKTLDKNLFQPLRSEIEDSFNKADGGELHSTSTTPSKMQALHSSSALAVNVFQYWMDKDISKIANFCKFCNYNNEPKKLFFEKKYYIDKKFDKPPNIDVVIENNSNNGYKAYAIESKFSEPFSKRNGNKGFKEKYFSIPDIWVDLPNIYKLAESISPEDNTFQILYPTQLIRHILGLKLKYGKSKFRLLYLYYESVGVENCIHKKELEKFAESVKKDNVKFHYLSYQDLIVQLREKLSANHSEYVNYLTERYL